MKILVFAETTTSAGTLLEQLQQLDSGYQIDVHNWPIENTVTGNVDRGKVDTVNVDRSLLDDVQLVLLCIANNISCAQLALLRRAIRIPIFLITPLLDEKTLVQLYAAGIDDHLVLPTSQPLLAAKLRVWERWLARVPTMIYH